VRPDNPQEVIGVDVGEARVGLARGSTIARIAEPLKTVGANEAITAIAEFDCDIVVVGLPRNLDGKDTQQTTAVRDWVKQASQKIDKPFYWQDEALTSKAAEAANHRTGSDAVAASIILQDFLDTPPDRWVRC